MERLWQERALARLQWQARTLACVGGTNVLAGVIRPIALTTDSRPGLALRAWAHLRRSIEGAALAALLALTWAQAAMAGTAQYYYYYYELGRSVETVAADGTSMQYRCDAVGDSEATNTIRSSNINPTYVKGV
jgi:hypothetical protein